MNGTLYDLSSQASLQPGEAVLFVAWGPAPAEAPTLMTFIEFPGTLVFTSAAPRDSQAFVDNLAAFLQGWVRSATTFAWLADPDVPDNWTGPILSQEANAGAVTSPFIWRQNNYALVIGAGCVAQFDPLLGSQPMLAYSPQPGGTGSIYFVADYGAATFDVVVAPQTLQLFLTSFLFNAGSMLFAIDTSRVQDGNALGLGLPYYVDEPEWPGWGRLRRVDFPFPLEAAEVPGLAFLFQPAPQSSIIASQPQTYPVGLTSGSGLVSLTCPGSNGPVANVFQMAIGGLTFPPGQDDPYTLTPSGSWTTEPSPVNLIPGLSGAEYFDGTTQLTFSPGFAYASLDEPALLESSLQTSYVEVSSLGYFAQPKSAVYYNTAYTGGPALEYLPVPLATQSVAAPIVPFARVRAEDVELAKELEKRVFSVARRSMLAPRAAVMTTGPDNTYGILPQGLAATWTPNQINYDLQVGQDDNGEISFQGVQAPLVDDLQSSQLFLVVTDLQQFMSALQDGVSSPTVTFGDWEFDLFDEEQWSGSPQTVLVFKFAEGSFGDLAGSTSAWTNPGYYNAAGGVSAAQSLLQASIAQAQQAYAAGASEYAYFLNTVVADPGWNGIIFFNVSIPPQSLPEPLAAVAGGDISLLAHHWGISASPVQSSTAKGQQPQPPTFGTSSVFGVVAYQAPSNLTSGDGDYDVQLQQLTVYFESSVLVSQSASIELMVPQFFGESVTLQNSSIGSNLIFNGTFQPDGSVAFAISGPAVFTVNSAVLQQIEITAAQLAPNPAVTGQWLFMLDGSIGFQTFSGFDLFSYGALACEGMAIDMNVGDDGSITWAFDARAMILNPAGSTTRTGSLIASMPIRPLTFLQVSPPESNSPPVTPESLGYLGVQAPVPQGTLSASSEWYGIICSLALGSAGGLVPGDFDATLLLAWSPSPFQPGSAPQQASPNLAIGLIFPGTSQSAPTTSSLQGVLKLTFGDVQLAMEPNGGYVLSISNVALSLLGIPIPPFGQTNAYFFGAPAGASPALGWYLGYAQG